MILYQLNSSEQRFSNFSNSKGFLSFHCNMNILRGYHLWFIYWLNEHFASSDQYRVCTWRHRQLEWPRFHRVVKRLKRNISFQCECCDRTHKTHLNQERALRLTVQTHLTRYIFTDSQKLKKGKANKSMHFTETNGLQAGKDGFAVIILLICWILLHNHTLYIVFLSY